MATIPPEYATFFPADGTEGFTDAELKKVAKASGKSQEEVGETIARFLLQNFSLGPSFPNQSEKLRPIYQSIKTRHLDIVDALLHRKDVESLDAVQEYLRRFLYIKNKSEILQTETECAVLSHDEIVSFPDIYPSFFSHMQPPPNGYADQLFAFIDKNGGIPVLEVSNVARFFYKHVAIYRKGRILVWRDLVEKWVKKSRKFETIDKIEGRLPYSWLRKIPRTTSLMSTNLSFQEYVYAETIAVLESCIGISLDEDLRKKILKQMEDENFRRHLVFYLGRFSYLLQELPNEKDPAFPWLVAIRRFVIFQRFFSFSEDRKNLLFRFIFYAESLPEAFAAFDGRFADLPKIEQKEPIEYFVVLLSRLEAVFRGKDFWKKGLLFLSISVDPKRGVECNLKVDCLIELGKSSYCTVTIQQMEQFFLAAFNKENFYHLLVIEFLNGMKVHGRSNRFLPVLCDPAWNRQKVHLAEQIVMELWRDGIEIEEVIAIFFNVVRGRFEQSMHSSSNDVQLLSELKAKVFAGIPFPEVALPKKMQEKSDLALRIKDTHKLSAAETFWLFLWNFSQTSDSIKQRCRLFDYIEAFPGLEIEKDSVLQLFHPDTNIEEVSRAINQLMQLSLAHSVLFTVSLT